MDVDLERRIAVIRDDREHGAGWLARVAVEALADAVSEGADPLETGRALARVRPRIGAIAGAVGRVLAASRSPEQLSEEAAALVARRQRAANSIAVLLSPHLHGTVMTHSASATVREALLRTPPDRIVCTASDPDGEGRRFGEELEAENLAVEVVADEDAEHAVATVDLLLLGADAVFADGSLVNKTGTSGLAAAAHEASVPVIVACETFKLAPFEPQDPNAERWDLTPPECIDTYVTEEGAFTPADIAALVDRTPFLRQGAELLRG